MHIAVYDHHIKDREETIQLIHRYCIQMSLSYDITVYDDGAVLLYDIEDGRVFDVLFLEIKEDVSTGIRLAYQLRDMDYAGAMVLLSSSPDLAYEGFAVHASGYLIKPLTTDKIARVMEHIVTLPEQHVYQVRNRQQVFRIPYQSIAYVESNNSKCILHSTNGAKHIIYKSLNTIEKELQDKRFLRCHQSFLVNMHHIKQVDNHFEMVNGEVVLIRQRQLKQVRQTFLDYITPFDRA